MSDNRKYYYLKLKENFYNSETMVILESMQDGLLYSNLLLKMYLMSLKSGGIWQKYTLSIEEASRYFRIGEKKLRRLAEENPDANWLIMNGNRLQIKRKQFEKVIDELEVI